MDTDETQILNRKIHDMNTDEITIEKGIPLPPKKQVGNRWGRGAKWAQTLRDMEIGDSDWAPMK